MVMVADPDAIVSALTLKRLFWRKFDQRRPNFFLGNLGRPISATLESKAQGGAMLLLSWEWEITEEISLQVINCWEHNNKA